MGVAHEPATLALDRCSMAAARGRVRRSVGPPGRAGPLRKTPNRQGIFRGMRTGVGCILTCESPARTEA